MKEQEQKKTKEAASSVLISEIKGQKLSAIFEAEIFGVSLILIKKNSSKYLDQYLRRWSCESSFSESLCDVNPYIENSFFQLLVLGGLYQSFEKSISKICVKNVVFREIEHIKSVLGSGIYECFQDPKESIVEEELFLKKGVLNSR